MENKWVLDSLFFFLKKFYLTSNYEYPLAIWLYKVDSLKYSSVQALSCVWLFEAPWTAARQTSLFITNSCSLLKLIPIESVSHPTISSSVVPFFSRFQSFPVSGSFHIRCFTSGGQNFGVSA